MHTLSMYAVRGAADTGAVSNLAQEAQQMDMYGVPRRQPAEVTAVCLM